jgi:hypothetical protein
MNSENISLLPFLFSLDYPCNQCYEVKYPIHFWGGKNV